MVRGELAAVAAAQGGAFTRAQARAAGYTERQLRTLTRYGGPWVVVRRGVYAEREVWEQAEPYDGHARLRDLAAHLMMRTDHVLSHDSAARLLRLPFFRPRLELSHVSRPGVGGSRTDHGVKHHRTRLRPAGLTEAAGVRVTDPARTAVDLAREHGRRTGLSACDSAMRMGATREQLRGELAMMAHWPGVAVARRCVEDADAEAETVGESLMRGLLLAMGLGEPDTQFPVMTTRGLAWADVRIGCHLFEFDGRLKFLPETRNGVATRPAEEVVWDEKLRQDAVCAEGLGMSRVVWEDLLGGRVRLTEQRLRAEFEATARRYGTELPEHLARFAEQVRRRRRR